MVTIINYSVVENGVGDSFISLTLQGDLTMIKSKSSGKFYATSKTCRMASTFDEATARLMVGKQIPGSIKKVECEPYDYVIPESNELVQLSYTYQFVPEDEETAMKTSEKVLDPLTEAFSMNGEQESAEA